MRRVSKEVGRILGDIHDPTDFERVERLLMEYAALIEPWAQQEAVLLSTRIAISNDRKWSEYMRKMGRSLRKEISDGDLLTTLERIRARVAYEITSIPIKEAERVRSLAADTIFTGIRPEELAAKIAAEQNITIERATLIARTEVSSATTSLAQARAESIGSTSYVWRSVSDGRTRPAHREMNGVVCQWTNPPQVGDEGRFHPGQTFNCRCYPEPII